MVSAIFLSVVNVLVRSNEVPIGNLITFFCVVCDAGDMYISVKTISIRVCCLFALKLLATSHPMRIFITGNYA